MEQPEILPDEAEELPYPNNETPPRGSDPFFGLLLAGAVSIGLTPLIGSGASDLRYTLSWGVLAGFSVFSWLFSNITRIERDEPENIAWGIAFGLLLGVPLLAFAAASLIEVTELLFRDLTVGTLLAYSVFVMPLAETLFFRSILQDTRSFWATGAICTAWQLVLFFPLMNRGAFPLLMGIIFLMSNLIYGYVRERNSLAAAWVCQIVVNIALLFLPFSGLL